MTYLRATVVTVALCMLSMISSAQTPATNQQSTVCRFADGGQLSVRYDPAPVHGDQLPGGHGWSPGEQPMYLFTTKAIQAGDTEIPAGAYSSHLTDTPKDRFRVGFGKRGTEAGIAALREFIGKS